MLPPDAFTAMEKISYFFKMCLNACGYLSMILCGMMVFCALGKQHASFPSLDSRSFTVSRCLLSSDLTSACILMIPGVMISPGLLLDVAAEILEKALK